MQLATQPPALAPRPSNIIVALDREDVAAAPETEPPLDPVLPPLPEPLPQLPLVLPPAPEDGLSSGAAAPSPSSRSGL